MKKLLAKLALISLLLLNFSFSTFADDSDSEDKIFTAEDCVKAAEENAGYIVTVLEEPIGQEQESDDFKIRRCFRNTVIFMEKGNIQKTTLSTLKRECVDDATLEGNVKANRKNLDGEITIYCDPVTVLISRGGTTMIEGYIALMYRWAASIVGVISVLVIVISGIQISAAGGESEAVNQAKSRILKSLGGLALLFLSGVLLYTINPNFFTL